jgi:formylglycine-generating enzyme required for sulfatase activity
MSPSWTRLLVVCGVLFALALLVPALSRADKDADVDPEPPGALLNTVGMKLKRIPSGKFMMGSPGDEKGRQEVESPQHEVEISKAFYLGVYEVTQKQYEKVSGKNPSQHQKGRAFADTVKGVDTSDFPVEFVSWQDAVDFCKKLSDLPAEKKAGRVYRLPTEAEWEYACRAGSKTPYNLGDELDSKKANVNPGLARTCKVGSYKPNKWGLYDMHGNVCEWCSDWYAGGYYKNSPKKDPPGPANGGLDRVMRGGCLVYGATDCRSARRDNGRPNSQVGTVGFRAACDLKR